MGAPKREGVSGSQHWLGPLVNRGGGTHCSGPPPEGHRTWEPRVAAVSRHRPSDHASPGRLR